MIPAQNIMPSANMSIPVFINNVEHRERDEAFRDLADFFRFCFRRNDLAVKQESRYLVAKQRFALGCCSAEFSVA